MPKSKRASVRRQILKSITETKRRINGLQMWWTTGSTVFVPPEERTNKNEYQRPRREEEYPENDPVYFAATMQEIDRIMADLSVLRETVVREYWAAKAAKETSQVS